MNFAQVVLYLYLLFPVFSVQQKNIAYDCGRKRMTAQEETDTRNELKSFLGLEDEYAQDSSDITDGADVPLPGGLENPQYGPQSEGSDLVQKETEGETKSTAEIQLLNSQKRMRLFEYGEEQLALNRSREGQRSIVSVNSKTMTRLRYDDSFRLLDKTVWSNGATVKESPIIRQTVYAYAQESTPDSSALDRAPPKSAKPISMTELFPQKKQRTFTTYDLSGNPILVSYYHEEEEKKDELSTATELPAKTKEVLDRKTVRTFSNENAILTEEETTYYEEPDPLRRGKKRPATMVRKNVYSYTKKASLPDLFFYENGILRMTTIYIDNDMYEESMFFDNDYTVKIKYDHGRKTNETIYAGKKIVKRQKFE